MGRGGGGGGGGGGKEGGRTMKRNEDMGRGRRARSDVKMKARIWKMRRMRRMEKRRKRVKDRNGLTIRIKEELKSKKR